MTEPAVADRRLHPAAILGRALRAVPEAAGGMAAFGAITSRFELSRVLILALIGTLVAAGIAFLAWWRFRYGVGSREIVIESGILRRQRRVIPYERVQDVAIERGLVARLTGTAKVRIETGGAAADEGELASISLAEAERLRDHVRGRHAPEGQEGGAAGEAEPEEPLLFAMGFGRVLLSGMFNFSLVFIAFLLAVVQNADELGLASPKALLLPIEQRLAGHWLAGTLALLLAVLVLGLVAGVVRTAARDFGFRLMRAPAGLRRRRGLFTLSETVIPLRRIQVAAIDGGLVARAFGWRGLAFQTLGADGRGGKGAQAAAPFARDAEIAPILAEAGIADAAGVTDWRRAPRRAMLHRAAAPLTLAIAAGAAGLLVEPLAFAAAALLLLLALGAPLRWSRHAYATGGGALFVAGGVLKQRLRIMPHAKLQAVSVQQGPLQRLLGLATVAVDTAGAPLMHGISIAHLEAADAQALATLLVDRFKEARSC